MSDLIGRRAEVFTEALREYIAAGGNVTATVDADTGAVAFAITDTAIIASLMARTDELEPLHNGTT